VVPTRSAMASLVSHRRPKARFQLLLHRPKLYAPVFLSLAFAKLIVARPYPDVRISYRGHLADTLWHNVNYKALICRYRNAPLMIFTNGL